MASTENSLYPITYTSFNYLKMKTYLKVLVLDIITTEDELRHNRIAF